MCVMLLTHLNVSDVVKEVDLRVNLVSEQKEVTEELTSRERTNQMSQHSDEFMARHLATAHGNDSDNTVSTFMYEVSDGMRDSVGDCSQALRWRDKRLTMTAIHIRK